MSQRSFKSLFFFALSVSVAACSLAHAALSNVVVNSTADTDANDAACTLREAILAVNAQASHNGCTFNGPATGNPTKINFAFAGSGIHEIDIASRLPAISKPIFIDGLTQTASDCTQWPPTLKVQISNPTNGAYNGLTLDTGSDGSTIRGLIINGFNNNNGYAFNFNAAINIYASGANHIQCNFLGTDASGTSAVANLRGVDINSSSNNIIGSDGIGSNFIERNLISGNQYGQVDTRGNALSGNRISGNFIGTNVTATAAMGGQGGADGVGIGANPGPASGNFVGWDGVGDPALMRNIISGFNNTNGAVSMVVGAIGNQVAGNYIGTDVSGTLAIPNGIGVELGSNTSVYGNIIGNNGTQDVKSARNVLSGNTYFGIEINGANGTHDNAVIGNIIGLNAAGNTSVANGIAGISMDYASASTLVARNWIGGQGTAVRFFGSGSFGGGSTASFINNAGGANASLPALDSRDNCVLGSVTVTAQGASVPSPNVFINNWWGAASGPNTAGASSADGSISANPWLIAPPMICSDTIFADNFDAN